MELGWTIGRGIQDEVTATRLVQDNKCEVEQVSWCNKLVTINFDFGATASGVHVFCSDLQASHAPLFMRELWS